MMDSLAVGMTWTATQLQQHRQQQQQQQQQEAAWLIYMRGMGLSMLDVWVCCRNLLKMLEAELHGAPLVRKFAALLLPAAKLAWALVETLQPAAAGSSRSSSSSSSGRQSRSLPPGVLPAAVTAADRTVQRIAVFATHFGPFAVPEIAKGAMSSEALKSDELLQVLLLYIACTAASLQQQQVDRAGSSSSSRRSRQAADTPPHMALLAALAPVLQQLPSDGHTGWASSDDLATWAPIALTGICAFLLQRARALQPITAAAALRSGLREVPPASSIREAVGEGMQWVEVLPKDQLLLPLLLTMVELAQLQPTGHSSIVQPALAFIVGLIDLHCPQLMPRAHRLGSRHGNAGGVLVDPPAPAAGQAAAAADALAEPLLLQLAPAMLQCLREQADEAGRIAISYALLVVLVLQGSE
jgi:hypothetical protein